MAHGLLTTAQATGMTFRERKAARIAAGNVKYRFVAECTSLGHHGETYGSFASRREAEEFAFSQRGPLVGNTLAAQAFWSAHAGYRVTTCPTFVVVRVAA